MNKLYDIIPNPKITCKYIDEYGKQKRLSKPDYRVLMSNPDIANNITGISNDDSNNMNSVVLKYRELAKKYRMRLHYDEPEDLNLDRNNIGKTQIRKDLAYNRVKNVVRQELSDLGYSEYEIADILISYLYGSNNKNKDLLWICYGNILYENLKKNKKSYIREVQCIDCGKWFEVRLIDTKVCRCQECQKEYRRKCDRERKRMSKFHSALI